MAALRAELAVLRVDVGDTLSVGVVADEVTGDDFCAKDSAALPLGVEGAGSLQWTAL